MMRFRPILTTGFVATLLANAALMFYVWVQQETISLVPRLKNEVKIIASVIPEYLDKAEIEAALRAEGYTVETGDEYYYAPKPNNTLFVGATYFVFSPSGSLMQIYGLSDSSNPIYENHYQAFHPTANPLRGLTSAER